MILDNVKLEGETEARILISSSKNISGKIIKCIQEMKDMEKLKKLEEEVTGDQKELDEEEARLLEYNTKMEKFTEAIGVNKEKIEKIRKETGELEKEIKGKEAEYEKLSSETKKEEEDIQDLRKKMGDLETKKKELDGQVKELKEFMTNSVKQEFTLQKEIESLKLQNDEYEEQNKIKETENECLKNEIEILTEKHNLLTKKKESIESQGKELVKQMEEEKLQIESLFQNHQRVLGEIIEHELAIKKAEMEKESLNDKISKCSLEKIKLEGDLMKLNKDNEQRSEEINAYLDSQSDTLRKMERLNKQKGKLGRVLKECKSIVYKSRKLLKQIRKIIPKSTLNQLKMSQTYENFYQSQNENKMQVLDQNSDMSEPDSHSEPTSNKFINISSNQIKNHSEENSDVEERVNEKMYYSTKPKQEGLMQEEMEEKRSQKMSSMRMDRFKKNKASHHRKQRNYFENNYSNSGEERKGINIR
jgi:chromosome segregation ATPase